MAAGSTAIKCHQSVMLHLMRALSLAMPSLCSSISMYFLTLLFANKMRSFFKYLCGRGNIRALASDKIIVKHSENVILSRRGLNRAPVPSRKLAKSHDQPCNLIANTSGPSINYRVPIAIHHEREIYSNEVRENERDTAHGKAKHF